MTCRTIPQDEPRPVAARRATELIVLVGSNIARVLRGCAVALWLAALGRPALAQTAADVPPGRLTYRLFGGADGLRNLVIISIAQDDDGFLWIGTEDGVYRYDGERFAHFSVDEGLASSLVHVVGVAPDGRVCVGSSAGLACWDGDRFWRATSRGLPAIPVLTLASHAGKLWVGTDGGGLYVQGSDGRFAPAPGWPGAATTAVRALWADASGLVVGDGATVLISAGDGAWRSVGEVGLGRDRVEGVLRDRRGALWIRTPRHMWFLPDGAGRATDLRDGFPTGFDATGAPNAMAIGPRGDVLIGTDDGVAYRDRDRWRTIGSQAGLPAATTRALLVDRDGDLWIGSAGLLQLRGRGLIEHHNRASGLPGEIVWTYLRDRSGALLAGTNRCLARATATGWACVPGTDGRVVRSVVFAPQGGMFVGGAPSDLLYIDRDGRTTSLGEPDRPDHNIYALALGPEGDLWVATKMGLYRLPGAAPGPLVPVTVPGIRDTARFGSFAVVGDRLWTTAAPGGVAVYQRGTWRVIDQAAGLRSSAASYLIARGDGRLCTAYIEALGATCFRYDGQRAIDVAHIGPADGLTAGMVYFLGEDAERRLWIGTGDGVNVVTPRGMDHFDQSDGLAGNDSASQAFLLDHDGSVWLGSTGGASHVLAQHYTGPPPTPRTALVAGRLGDQPIGTARTGLEVPHDHSALTLDFAAGSLLDARRVEYQLRLSPHETEWGITHQRQVHYPALLPGAYRFEVRARVDAGSWGHSTAFAFAVLPAWWQTRWFAALVVVAALALIGAVFTWWLRKVLRRRTRQLHEQTEAGFRAVIDLMPDLISMQRGGKVVYLNLALRRLMGIDDLSGRWEELDLMDRVHPDDRAQVIDLFRRVGELEPELVSEALEVRIRGADGSWRICEVSGTRVKLGGSVTVVSSGRDVTERQRLRAKLLVSDRMASLGTLAAGIAHEINNPLAYVTGNLEAMSETLDAVAGVPAADRAELDAQVRDARDGAERVRKIVHGLRSFSRPEQETRVPLALPDVIEAAIRLTGNELRHRARLERDLQPTPLVSADDGRLTQVFINLLINAAHAIPEGRSDDNCITVRAHTDDQGRAVVEIEDTGKGIAPDVQARVFDPFFTTKGIGEGTGLGLSICHGIVSGLGGQI
jgi:PAS domain S-box-containing protein